MNEPVLKKIARGCFKFVKFLFFSSILAGIGYAFYATNVWYKVGDTFLVNQHIEVVAHNVDPIATKYGDLHYGDSCTIQPAGIVTIVVGIGAQGVHESYILATYKHSDTHMLLGMCPGQHDLPFFVTKAQLDAMLEAEKQKKKEALIARRKRAIVEQFLGDKKKG